MRDVVILLPGSFLEEQVQDVKMVMLDVLEQEKNHVVKMIIVMIL